MKKFFKKVALMVDSILYRLCCRKKKENWILVESWNGHYWSSDMEYLVEELSKKLSMTLFKVQSLTSPNRSEQTISRYSLRYYLYKGRAQFIIMNTYPVNQLKMMPLKNCPKIVVLWHAVGLLKKVGKDRKENSATSIDKASKRLAAFIVSSSSVVASYSVAFGVSLDRVLPLGLPRSDWLLKNTQHREFLKRFDVPNNKKIILYAPTLQRQFWSPQEQKLLKEALSQEYVMWVCPHPLMPSLVASDDFFINMASVGSEKLISACDMVITDYSSIIFEVAILEKPIFFFVPDRKSYEAEVGLYMPLEMLAAGPISDSLPLLIEAIKNFKESRQGYLLQEKRCQTMAGADGFAVERIALWLLENQ